MALQVNTHFQDVAQDHAIVNYRHRYASLN